MKVCSPRWLQGLLNQSNSNFERSSRAQLQMMIYVEVCIWIQSPCSLPEVAGMPDHQQSPHWGGETHNDLFSRACTTFSLKYTGFCLLPKGILSLSWNFLVGHLPYLNPINCVVHHCALPKKTVGSVWVLLLQSCSWYQNLSYCVVWAAVKKTPNPVNIPACCEIKVSEARQTLIFSSVFLSLFSVKKWLLTLK